MIRLINSFIVIVVFFIALGCKEEKKVDPERGVSLQLHQWRKQQLEDILYQLSFDIPERKADSIPGTVTITFNLLSTVDDLVIDFSAKAGQVKSVKTAGAITPYQFVNEHLVIDKEHLVKGTNSITIEFTAGDLSLNRNENYLYTLFVPDRASTCFPLFDQPNLKASYEVTLTTPKEWEAVSNGVLRDRHDEYNKSVYVFEKTKPISSYLFAFAAGKFFKTTRLVNECSMTMYYRETDSVKVSKNLNDVFELHGKALDWLENYTSIEYPFDKFDFVLIPSFQYGGMEHPGSIFYSESGLLLDDNASINRKMGRASLIAHETAHMWFGDLVTMNWFNDVWMKEVFANFMAAKIVQPSFPEINHDLRFLLAHYPSAYDVDRTTGANPIMQPLTNLKNAGTLYGAIIYQKAPIVMRHLERKIGPELMQVSLQEYLKTYAFKNATWDDLVSIIDAKSEEDIESWSRVWVKTAGMPAYTWVKDSQLTQVRDTVASRIWEQSIKIHQANRVDTVVDFNSEKPIRTHSDSLVAYLNADGFGYGYFKVSDSSKQTFLTNSIQYTDPVFRASMWINSWESMLRGDGPVPDKLIQSMLSALQVEENPLVSDYLLGNLQTAWWIFLPEHNRSLMQDELETTLWDLMQAAPDAGRKSTYFRAYRNVVMSEKGLLNLEQVWNGELEIMDLKLSEEDKISVAYELGLKTPARQQEILTKQLEEVKNADRKERMKFVMPALSNDQKVRDSFFESLKQEQNREHEAWVLEALHYLHHPLRAKTSDAYLRPSLELLQEVQLTGDIFFPQRWLQTTFSGHSSAEAVKVVDKFILDHPDYPYYLKDKILQSTDLMKRAVALKSNVINQNN
jgi:aminopeptidase N